MKRKPQPLYGTDDPRQRWIERDRFGVLRVYTEPQNQTVGNVPLPLGPERPMRLVRSGEREYRLEYIDLGEHQ